MSKFVQKSVQMKSKMDMIWFFTAGSVDTEPEKEMKAISRLVRRLVRYGAPSPAATLRPFEFAYK